MSQYGRPSPCLENVCKFTEGGLETALLFLIIFVFVRRMSSQEIKTFFPFDYLDLKISNQQAFLVLLVQDRVSCSPG